MIREIQPKDCDQYVLLLIEFYNMEYQVMDKHLFWETYKKIKNNGGVIYVLEDIKNQALGIPEVSSSSITKNSGFVLGKPSSGLLKMEYGIIFLKFTFDNSTGYKNETINWGANVLYDTPNRTWAFSLILMLTTCLMMVLNLLSLMYSFCSSNKGRVYSISVIYTWLGTIFLMIGILIFPFTWKNLQTYHIGWWNNNIPEDIDREQINLFGTDVMKDLFSSTDQTFYEMCPDSDLFNPGECKIGYSYILVIISFFTAIFSYNCLRFALNKKYEQSEQSEDKKSKPFISFSSFLPTRNSSKDNIDIEENELLIQ